MTVIADDNGAEGIGGVMGGEHSGCSEATTEVFIECAWFDPVRTATTGRKLGIHSDARHRFERTVDPGRSEEHTSELQSLMRISYAVFCLKKKTNKHKYTSTIH